MPVLFPSEEKTLAEPVAHKGETCERLTDGGSRCAQAGLLRSSGDRTSRCSPDANRIQPPMTVPKIGNGIPTTIPASSAFPKAAGQPSFPNRRWRNNVPMPPSRNPATTKNGVDSPSVTMSCEKNSQSSARIHAPVTGNKNRRRGGSTNQRLSESRDGVESTDIGFSSDFVIKDCGAGELFRPEDRQLIGSGTL